MSLVDDIKTLFPDARVADGYVRVRCPYHKGGQERKPSMSILTRAKNGLEAGFATCFTCGWKGTFGDIAEDYGLKYVEDNATEVASSPPPKVFQVNLQQSVSKKDTPYSYSPYLATRGITQQVQEQFRIFERLDEKKVYLPVFSKESIFLYANARSTDKKMFFIPYGIKKDLAYIEGIDMNKPIAICESQIDALTFYSAQFCRAVATLGATSIDSLNSIKTAAGPFLLAFDGDTAGRKATTRALDLLGDYRCKVIRLDDEDINNIWVSCGFNPDLFSEIIESRIISSAEARKSYCLPY